MISSFRVNWRRLALFLTPILFLISCETPKPKVDAAAAAAQAKTYMTNLAFKDTHGPVCMPEGTEYVQCSFTHTDAAGQHVSTLLCNNGGCREGTMPVAMSNLSAANSPGSNGVSDDWLLYYLLLSNNNVGYNSYGSWYSNTPSYGRQAYYSPSYKPTSASKNYYSTTYGSKSPTYRAPSTSTSKPSAVAAPSTSSSKSSTVAAPSASTSSKSKSSSSFWGSSSSGTSSKSTRSTGGWGSSSRSSGYKSSSSSRGGRR